MRRCSITTIIVAATLLGAPFIVPLFSPWSPINCREFELDLVSGQQRVTRYVYWIPLKREIRDTPASLAQGNATSDPGDREWVRTDTFGPYSQHSPHYAYHSAPHQIRMLELVWDEFDFDAEARRTTAHELLRRLKSSRSDWIGNDYLRELKELGDSASRQ